MQEANNTLNKSLGIRNLLNNLAGEGWNDYRPSGDGTLYPTRWIEVNAHAKIGSLFDGL